MASSTLHLASAALYVIAYAVATLIARWNEVHQDMCPIYAAITLAALLHLIMVVRQRRNDSLRKLDEDRSPITSAMRITYYDHNGDPYRTEWEKIHDSVPVAGVRDTDQGDANKQERHAA